MISIVLPVYNGEKYLKYSIESILNQTYKDIELIIVNDCSTDNTSHIIDEYRKKDSRITIVNNTTNQKLPKSLNIGFSHCKGEYYTWTSDDNIMLPSAMEKLLYDIQKKGADLAFSRCETINSDGKIIGRTELYNDLNELYCNNIVLASFLYKKEVHDELNGYDVNKFLVEDYDFWLRAYRKFKFYFEPEILYQIRFHSQNLGVTRLEQVKLCKIELLKENLSYINDERIIDSIYREISNCYFQASNSYYGKILNKKDRNSITKERGKDFIKKILGR